MFKKQIPLSIILCVSLAGPVMAQGMSNGLPATSQDSFVYESSGLADMIYGDEGTDDIPPLMGFTVLSRINTGIFGQRDAGLTTGHGSLLPDAWGGDEFIGPEWSLSGPGITALPFELLPSFTPTAPVQPQNQVAQTTPVTREQTASGNTATEPTTAPVQQVAPTNSTTTNGQVQTGF